MKRYKAIAAYYDAENQQHEMLKHDVPFFLGQLPKKRQDILELAVGTARAAIPLAQAGHRVVGVDYVDDMLAIARRKRDAVGLTEKQLKLVRQDALKLDLRQRFDWVVILFNTLLAFTTLEELDRLLQNVRRHLKPRGRFWLDVFNPDHAMLSREQEKGIDRDVFFVPEFERTVYRQTDITRDTARQVMRITNRYTWFDAFGREKRERFDFDMTCVYPRELQLLLERNGLQIEHLWGNYDGSEFAKSSPRMIARCTPM
ncbi:MAG: Methyltransferase type 11 [Phycisphaerales bacterium]|nr:Methyltransferase type 11 [Phycisphaerales bacterium]